MPPIDYSPALAVALDAAIAAGEILRADFHRPGGPRPLGTSRSHAMADDEAQLEIHRRLTAFEPAWGFRGEEDVTPVSPQHPTPNPQYPGSHLWLVDPNDGTRNYLQGARGSAVAIALLRDGEPVLGVVYAFGAPDDAGDLVAWAASQPLTRNGAIVRRAAWPAALTADTVVLVSPRADRRARENLAGVAPGRFLKCPSPAYRLALAAVGDADAAVVLASPHGWDIAAGHALVRGAGGQLIDAAGQQVAYTPEGDCAVHHCFGGAPAVVETIRQRDWDAVTRPLTPAGTALAASLDFVTLLPGRNESDAGRLRRAQGCLLGQLAGDALGSQVEFQSAERIRRAYPGGLRRIAGSPVWNTIAGQPTDDSELALALARSIVKSGGYDAEEAAQSYVAWYHSHPYDIGMATQTALSAPSPTDLENRQAAIAASRSAMPETQANGSLMRISPLAIWGASQSADTLADHARADSRITHPSPVCQESCAVFVVAVAHAIATGANAPAVYDHALGWATTACRESSVLAGLRRAANHAPETDGPSQGWVLIALQNAFYQLLHAPTLEEGVIATASSGGDTDTNAAIAGALLGAVHGRDAIPLQWRQAVLSCRPLEGAPGVRQPRPGRYWPVDALEIAERLVVG